MNQETIVMMSDAAINHIKKNIAQQNALGFRLAVKKTGCSGYAYLPDIIHAVNTADICINTKGINLYIDKNSEKFLRGTRIDFIDQGMGHTRLIFHNPNAAGLCGCGESFNLTTEFEDE